MNKDTDERLAQVVTDLEPEQMAEIAQEQRQQRSDPESNMRHSVREVEYKGRTIRIETSYRITIDGEPVLGHVMVSNDGRVHYHSIPNQEFESAVDMVKRVIDLLPPSYSSQKSQGGE